MNTKKIMISVLAVTILGGSLVSTQGVYAAETTSNPFNSVIEAIAKKFGLKQEEVSNVVNTVRADKQKEMQKNFTARLDAAVKEGKLTEEQKKLIVAKHEELKKERGEKRQGRMQDRTELEAWAKQNDIDMSYFGQGPGRGMGQGRMMR